MVSNRIKSWDEWMNADEEERREITNCLNHDSLLWTWGVETDRQREREKCLGFDST